MEDKVTLTGCLFLLSAMVFACWNVRGLNDPLKEGEVRKLISEHRLSLCGLIETRVKEIHKGSLLMALAREWKALCNYQCAPNGRILLCWNLMGKELDLVLLGQSAQVIHCRVSAKSRAWSCIPSFVYGENCHSKRKALIDMSDFSSFPSLVGDNPWLVIGDFNAIRWNHERLGRSRDWPDWMGDLDNCVLSAGLFDLRFCGLLFSWSNRREDDPILKKLDRALVNCSWEASFSGSEVSFLPAGVSATHPLTNSRQ